VREALDSKPGDLLAWKVGDDGEVTVRRLSKLDVDYLRAVEGTLSEWHSAEDEAAYGDL
jgi:hypothetical protein